jgi:hypothetical protein
MASQPDFESCGRGAMKQRQQASFHIEKFIL